MKRLVLSIVLVTALVNGVQAQNGAAAECGVICVSAAYMYQKPDYESSLETQELMGVVVKLGERDRYWIKADAPQPYTAWLTERCVVPLSETELDAYMTAPKYIVTSMYSTVFDGFGKNAAVMCNLVAGDILRVAFGSDKKPVRKGGRLGVTLPDGRHGWVDSKALERQSAWRHRVSTMDAAQKVETAVTFAQNMLGVPYLWGGMTTCGADCSGLVRLAYMMAGESMPRNASQMARHCIQVPLGEIRRGDLLFFGRDGRVTHVGIYLGNGRMIHCSHMVRINSIRQRDSDCYENIHMLMSAGRVVE